MALYGGAAIALRRKAAGVAEEEEDESDCGDVGLEMLRPAHQSCPLMERRINEGFRAWMGDSVLSSSSDDEDGPVDHFDYVTQ